MSLGGNDPLTKQDFSLPGLSYTDMFQSALTPAIQLLGLFTGT